MNDEKNPYIDESVQEFSEFDLKEHVKHEVVKKEEGLDIEDVVQGLFDSDFDTARKNILMVAKHGEDVLESMIDVAKASHHPRAYEVVATIMKTITDANKDLLDLHKKKKEITEKKPESVDVTNVTNNVAFVGTTNDLEKIISERMKQQIIEHNEQ